MRTTININIKFFERLNSAAEALHISIHNLTALLIKSVIQNNSLNIRAYNCVRYQKADPEKQWKIYHVRFDPHMYETCLDCRKFGKVSVSLLISFAIVHFLDELVEELSDETKKQRMMDNYSWNYVFIAKTIDDIQGFIILWGKPKESHMRALVPGRGN